MNRKPKTTIESLRDELAQLEAEQLRAELAQQEVEQRKERRAALTKQLAELRVAVVAQQEVEQRKEGRTKLTKQLGEVRTELRTKRSAFDKLAKRILHGQEDLNAVQGNMMAVIDALGRYQAAKPSVVDFLPSDPEAVEWNDNVRILSERLEKLKAEKLALPNVQLLRIEAIGMRERIAQLKCAEGNIVSELDGTLAVNRVGGVFAPIR